MVNRTRTEEVKRRKDALVAKKALQARQSVELDQRWRRQWATNEKEESSMEEEDDDDDDEEGDRS